jgi:2-polyprenyl-6-methoxyphenol hydroxylase-like FAD-dependent oxidoreductase
MAINQYDAIVVGARCAGSPTAMLLARKGYKVLVVDRRGSPATPSPPHLLHPPGVAALARWGLLEPLVASGDPRGLHRRVGRGGRPRGGHRHPRPRPPGGTVTEHAKVVVGADGRHSLVARAVQPEHYQQRPRLQVSYYGYWSDLPMAGRFETYLRPDRGFASPAESFSEENVRRITLRAGAAAPA